MSDFDFRATTISGLQLIERWAMDDTRGFFERVFCQASFGSMLGGKPIQQINRTLTFLKGTVRGMHFQYPPHAETKLVSCVSGEVFDVAVDLRADSPTFLRWHGEVLSESNCLTMVVPEGFAHGFQALTDNCEMLYLHTAGYCADAEGAINALDPMVAIAWPQAVVNRSERDSAHPMLTNHFTGIDMS